MNQQSASPAPANTQIIFRNSFWLSLEVVFSLFGAFFVSIIVAGTIGPVSLGNFYYLVFLTNITAAAGNFGLPITTRKYMAEYLNRNQQGVARSIYGAVLRVQVWIAAAVTVIAVGLSLYLEPPGW